MSLTALWYAVILVLAFLQGHSLWSNQHSADLTESEDEMVHAVCAGQGA